MDLSIGANGPVSDRLWPMRMAVAARAGPWIVPSSAVPAMAAAARVVSDEFWQGSGCRSLGFGCGVVGEAKYSTPDTEFELSKTGRNVGILGHTSTAGKVMHRSARLSPYEERDGLDRTWISLNVPKCQVNVPACQVQNGSRRSRHVGQLHQDHHRARHPAFRRRLRRHQPGPFHEEFAKTTMFKGRIAHGMLSASYISTVLGMQIPAPGTIFMGLTALQGAGAPGRNGARHLHGEGTQGGEAPRDPDHVLHGRRTAVIDGDAMVMPPRALPPGRPSARA